MRRFTQILLLAFCLFAALPAFAASVTYTTTIPVTAVPFGTNGTGYVLTVPQFNPALGTLTSVSLKIVSFSMTAVDQFETLNTGGTLSASYSGKVQVDLQSATLSATSTAAVNSLNGGVLVGTDGVQDFAGADAATLNVVVANNTVKTTSSTNGTVLAAVKGTGTVNFLATSTLSSQYDTAQIGNLRERLVTTGTATVQVVYTYTGSTAFLLGDTVWSDTNNNGIQDAGETGIPGVKVNICSGTLTACAPSTTGFVGSSVTDLSGLYGLGVVPGAYTVAVDPTTLPALYKLSPSFRGGDTTKDSNATDPNNNNGGVATVTIGSSNDLTIDFGYHYTPQGSIGDFVWKDLNHNGIQDDGNNSGIDGVTVNLCSDSACNTVLATTTTAPLGVAHGYYQFNNLSAGTYWVVVPSNQAALSGLQATFTGQGTTVTDSNGSPAQVILATDFSTDQTIDFGYTTPATSAIGNFVWSDTNQNGIQEAGEPGIGGVKIYLGILSDCSDKKATTTTDPTGFYQFTGLFSGNYYVCVDASTVPANYVATTTGQGTASTDSNGSPASVSLPDAFTDNTIDFGYIPPASGAIGDYVWYDLNRNGVQDTGEAGINNVMVRLLDSTGTQVAVTHTMTNAGVDGYYQFSGLKAGSYTVVVDTTTLPAGYFLSSAHLGGNPALDSNGVAGVNTATAAVTLATDYSTDQTIDFGFQSPCIGKIGDFVWNDANANGVQDAGELGISGVTVNLHKADNTLITFTNTDGSGAYSFGGLCPATYLVEVVTPNGYVASPTGVGSTTTDSNASPTTVNLANDATDNSIDFGFYQLGSIGDRVWLDANGDGSQINESGLVGWTVQINGPNSYTKTMVTGADGIYSFTGLFAGSYNVCVTPQAGYSETYDLDGLGTANCATVILAGGQNRTDVDFGYQQPPSISCVATPAGEVGAAFNAPAPSITGGTPPYNFSIDTGTLPSGLTLNPVTGAITGTPTAAGSFTIKMVDANGNTAAGSCPYTINPAPSLACATVTAGTVGAPFTAPALTVTNGTAPFTFSVDTGSIPAGLTLDASTGAITGTPTAAGSFTIKVTDAKGVSASGNCPYSINVAPSLTCATVSAGTVGAAFNGPALTATGGTAPLTYSVATGTLPAGLTLNTSTGAITGTPTSAGQFTLKVTDANGVSASGNCPYTVNSAPALACVSAPAGEVGAAFDVAAPTVTGGTAPLTYSVATGALPAGVTLNADGSISGTPTAVGSFTIKVTDANGVVSTGNCPYSVGEGPSLACVSAPAGEVGAAYTVAAPTVTGGIGPFTFSLASGGLPAGVSLNTDGSISGLATGTGSFTIKVTDSKGLSSTGNCSYSVGQGPSLACVSAPAGEVGAAYTVAAPTVTGGIGPFTFSLASGSLPAGVSLNADGSISGLATGTGSFTIKVTDSKGLSSTGNCSYSVGQGPSLACVSAPAGEVGAAYTVAAPTVTGGIGPFTFSLASGSLPAGVSLNADGSISGLATGTGNFTIKVTDSKGLSSTGNCQYSVGAGLGLACVSAPAGEVGVAYNVGAPTITGGIAPYTFSVATGALPAGVSLNADGSISGLATGTGSFTIKVTDSKGLSSTGNCSYSVGQGPSLACVSAPAGEVGAAYTVAAPTVTGGIGPFTFSLASGSLPAGVSLNADGSISGLATGTGNFTIKVTDSKGLSSTGNCQYSVGAGLGLACVSAPAGEVGAAYTVAAPTISGGIGPFTFSVATGALPTGVSLNADGSISGTPTGIGSFTIKVTDSKGLSSTGNCQYSVGAGLGLACVSAPAGEVGVAYNVAAPTISGGIAPYTFSVATGALPAGVSLNADGSISGTPTGIGSFTIKVTDSKGLSSTGNCQYSVGAGLSLACVSAPAGEVGAAYTVAAPTVTGGIGPFTFSLASGSLPAGVSLNADGSISGLATGTGSFTIKVTDSKGLSSTGICPYAVGAGLSLACVSAPAGEVGAAYTVAAPTVSGGIGPFTFSLASGSLPAGVSLNADGSISGLATGTGSFTIKVTDSKGLSSTGNCPYSVGPAPSLACVATAAGQAGMPYSAAAPTVTGGTAPYTFAVATGTMPAGLTLNTSTGVITGTPAAAGTWTIKVTDAKGITAAGTCSYTVAAAPATTPVAHGDAATIGFWHNKNGQALILAMNGSASAKNLATWLATSFPNLYGASSANNLTGKTNTDVAALFMTFFNVKGTNTDAQVMAGALAIYVTSPTLAGSSVSAGYGFNVSTTGTGAKTYNTGANGTAIGLSNNTSYTVLQLMQAANAVAPYSSAEFNALNTIFNGINTTGDII